jgi:hypothetical protein
MNDTKPRYARQLVIVTLFALCTHMLLAGASYSPAESATGTALIMLALLALLTGVTAAVKAEDEPGHVSAARLLAMAGCASAASIAAARVSGHVAFLLVGFFVGIPYVAHALRKDIDDHISLAFLLFASIVQVSIVFWIVS